MFHSPRKNQINRCFLPLVMSLYFIILMLYTPAQAGPTTGQLQEQIDELTACINRLRALIEDPNHKSYTAGISAISTNYEDCVIDEWGIECNTKTAILVDVVEQQPIRFEAVLTATQEDLALDVRKSPSENPLSSADYKVNVEVVTIYETNNFSVSPEDPIYSFQEDPSYFGNLDLKCELLNDWRIRITGYVGQVKQIRRESLGAIVEAHIEPYTESATATELKVHIRNYYDYKSTYIVTATGFGPSIEPVVADYVTLEPYEEATLTLPIRTVDTFAGQGPCLVTLKSTTGRIYQSTTADFPTPLPDGPAPQYIPDFDGDGDVDFADFSYFSMFWLEQPET